MAARIIRVQYSQMNPVDMFIYYFYKIHFNDIFPSPFSGLFPSCSPTKILSAFLISLKRATCPNYFFFLVFDEECKTRRSSFGVAKLLQVPVTSFQGRIFFLADSYLFSVISFLNV